MTETPAAPALESAAPVAPSPSEASVPEMTEAQMIEKAMGEVDLDSLNLADLEAFERGDTEGVRKTLERLLPAKKEPPKAKAPETDEDPQGDDETQPAPGEAPRQPGQLPGRVSIKHLPPDQGKALLAILDAARAGKSLEDAAREVLGITSAPAAASPAPAVAETPAAAPAPIAVPASSRVQELGTKLVELQANYKKLQSDFDPAASDVLEQMQDVKLDLRDARSEEKAQIREAHTFHSNVAASQARMVAAYSDLRADPQFDDFAEAEITLAENRGDPIMFQHDWPEQIASRVKAKYFSRAPDAKSAAPAADTKQPIPPAPKTNTVRFPGSPAGGAYAPGAISTETALTEIGNLSSEQIDALLVETERNNSRAKR